MTNVGFVGLGRMGRPMARSLLRAGYELTVFNRSAGPAEELQEMGASIADTPAELASRADVVITMLADGDAVADVTYGTHGLLAGATDNSVLIDMSTTGPAFAQELAKGAGPTAVLDAPVSGSVALAEAAKLTTIVGGKREVFDRVRQVLGAMTAEQIWLGGSGSGAAMKLALNGIVAATNQAISEGLVVAEESGIDRDAAYTAIASSAVRSPFVDYKRDAFVAPQDTPAAFSLALMQKDIVLYMELARRLGVPVATPFAVDQTLTLARRLCGDEADIAAVAAALRSVAETRSPEVNG